MSNKQVTCEHKYKIGNSVYCKIRVDDCGFCSRSVSKCQYAVKIPARNNRAYYSFKEGCMVRKNGSFF